MNASFRVLIAVKDEKIRMSMSGLLKTVKAKQHYADTPDAVMTYLGTPDGMDLVLIDDAWNQVSVDAVFRASRSKPRQINPYLVVLVEGADVAAALLAFNAGADAVLRKPLDPIEFLNACRAGQRVSVVGKRVEDLEHFAATLIPEPEPIDLDMAAAVEAEEKMNGANGTNGAKRLPEAEAELAETPAGREAGSDDGVDLKKAPQSGPLKGLTFRDGFPLLMQQVEASTRHAIIELGVNEGEVHSAPTEGATARGDLVGWQGAFSPASNHWFDILFYFNRPGIEALSQKILGRATDDDEALLRCISSFLGNIQYSYKRFCETDSTLSSVVLCPPHGLLRLQWVSEAGKPAFSQTIRFPNVTMVCDFHISPGALRIKPVGQVEPGDVLNEVIAAANQQRIPLASRGMSLTQDRLDKIKREVEPTRTLWVIEPSLLARCLSRIVAV